MADTLVLNPAEFEIPENDKVAKVFDRLMKINTAATQDGLREVYYERYDRYIESYSIGLF